MLDKLNKMQQDALDLINKSASMVYTEEIKNRYLSRKSELNFIKKSLKDLDAESRCFC